MKRLLAVLLLSSATAFAQPTYDMTADVNYPNRDLQSLKMLQGSTPKLRVYIQQKGSTYTNIATDTLTFYYADSPTAAAFVTVTNSAVDTANGYFDIEFTSGDLNTNGSFYYTVLLKSAAGGTYWSGDGSLEIEETTVTGSPASLTLTTPIDWITALYSNGAYGPAIGDGSTITQTTNASGQLVLSSAGGGSGDVTGPASAINENITVFDGTTGKVIKDSGESIAGITAAYVAADTIVSNDVTAAFEQADINAALTITGEYVAADVIVSNGVTAGYIAADALKLSLTGGTLTGSLLVGTDSIYNLGSSSEKWGMTYTDNITMDTAAPVIGAEGSSAIMVLTGGLSGSNPSVVLYGTNSLASEPGDILLDPVGITDTVQIDGSLDMKDNDINNVQDLGLNGTADLTIRAIQVNGTNYFGIIVTGGSSTNLYPLVD